MKYLLTFLVLLASYAHAQDDWTTTNRGAHAVLVKYYDTAISTNHPTDYPWTLHDRGDGVIHMKWTHVSPAPSQATLDAIDPEDGNAIIVEQVKEKAVQRLGTLSEYDKAVFEILFVLVNEMRTDNGQGTLTKQEFKAYIKGKM